MNTKLGNNNIRDCVINTIIIIYANHMLRSSCPAMAKTTKCILENEHFYGTNGSIMKIDEIQSLIPG